MTKEQIYDEQVAPLLAQAGKICEENDIPMMCIVEYEKEKLAFTTYLGENHGLSIKMVQLTALSAPNIDQYLFSLIKYCDKNNIKTTDSIFLNLMNK